MTQNKESSMPQSSKSTNLVKEDNSPLSDNVSGRLLQDRLELGEELL